MMVQLFRPGNGSDPGQHRVLGYTSLVTLTLGVVCACVLAAEHGAVAHYGGNLSMLGFWFMEFVLGPLLRNYDTVSILICIWFSAPLGILIAEIIRRRAAQVKPSSVNGGIGTGAIAH